MTAPFTELQASKSKGVLTEKDLQKISSNEMTNKAWQNGQDTLGVFLVLGLLGTGLLGTATCQIFLSKKKDDNDATPLALVFTTLCGLATTGCSYAWYKVVKKRMKRHGEKNFWKFIFVDRMSRDPNRR